MIHIVIPFEQAEKKVGVWACDERNINFDTDIAESTRCTMAFGALELKKYLDRILDEEIKISSTLCNEINIQLKCKSSDSTSEKYMLTPSENGMIIQGESRIGVLYGVYELLKMQGICWNYPGEAGEYIPEVKDELILPRDEQTFEPATKIGRGFEFGDRIDPSPDLLLWMCRNRLNLAGCRPATSQFAKKLGMHIHTGGHLFEPVMNPDRLMPSGKILWDEHREWFGTPKNGEKDKSRALTTQACMSQPALMDFLAEELISYINNEWSGADIINVWNFDTWGDVCCCEECKKLGNATDQTLRLLSEMRTRVNKRVTRKVRLVMCAYEGSASIEPPLNPVPQNLIDAGDYVTYAPILRCFAHGMDDENCSFNSMYKHSLEGWLKTDIPISICEYYNVSRHEDLPLLFTNSIKHDISYYIQNGIKGFTYMHLPNTNWAMRTLTQLVYAELTWNPDADIAKISDRYFETQYGICAEEMKAAYSLIEEASKYCANWRAWGSKSILANMHEWDGEKPKNQLTAGGHFKDGEAVCENGRNTVDLLKKALNIVEKARAKMADAELARLVSCQPALAINPAEIAAQRKNSIYSHRLGEDKRLLIYGIDTATLMTSLAKYHTALYQDDTQKAETAWKCVIETEEKLNSYFMPITYDGPNAGINCYDAMTRTQLREVILRCKKYRQKRMS